MLAFNSRLNKVVDIDRVEDLSSSIILITELQKRDILDSLNNGGFATIKDGELFTSGPKPKDHEYDYAINKWVFNQSLKDARLLSERSEAWDKIKEARSKSQKSGVYVGSLKKWFHTDEEAQRNYLFLKVVIDYAEFKPPYWKTMDGSFVLMTPDLYKNIVLQMFWKAQHDFKNAEYLNKQVNLSENPLEVNFNEGWSESYYNN